MILLQTIELYPVNILQIIFSIISALGALLIWGYERYRGLAVFLIYFCTLMFFNFSEEMDITRHIYLVTPVFTFLHGPAIFFFVRTLVNDKPLILKQKIIHLLPAIMALPYSDNVELIIALATISQLVYLTLSFKLLNRYHSASMAVRSDAVSLTLSWVFKVLSLFTIFVIFDLIRLNLKAHISHDIRVVWYFIDLLIYFLIVCFLIFKAIRNTEVFDEMALYEQLGLHEVGASKKNELAMAKQVFENIEESILSNRLYKRPRLSVNDISEATGLNVKDISWAINTAANRNFCEYINGIRIKHVQQQFKSNIFNKISILDIALESGFNSKSTFNAVFKKEVGLTPTQFIKSNNKNKNL
jgi:AraC-like DNA-binding protein